jgi:hypothetical protein
LEWNLFHWKVDIQHFKTYTNLTQFVFEMSKILLFEVGTIVLNPSSNFTLSKSPQFVILILLEKGFLLSFNPIGSNLFDCIMCTFCLKWAYEGMSWRTPTSFKTNAWFYFYVLTCACLWDFPMHDPGVLCHFTQKVLFFSPSHLFFISTWLF